jgi:hypothetical protein
MMSRGHAFIIRRHGKRDQHQNVLGIAHIRSTGAVANSVLCLRVAIAVLLGSLLLAAAARAEPVTQSPTEATTPVSGPPQETTAPVGEPPQETTAPVSEASQETVVPVSEAPAGAPSPLPVKEAVAETVTPVKEASQEAAPTPVVEPEVLPPVATVIERVTEVTAPVDSSGGQAEEPALGTSGSAGTSEASATLVAGAPLGGAPPPPSSPSAPALETSSRVMVVAPLRGELSSSAVKLGAVAPLRLTAAQRAEDLSCQLSGLSGSATDNCTASWSGTESFTSASAAIAAGSTSTTGSDGTPGGGYGGSTGATRTVVPPPGPAPSGAFGGAAAGGSGIALSGFFTLAGLLLMSAPLAMRRLRLSCRPWLTAFFVLIPERPG